MKGSAKSYIKTVSIIVLSAVVIGYSLFSARHLIEGPDIEIYSPTNGTSTPTALVEIVGNASNISYITMNDRPIFINEDGAFKERLLLSPGLNIIEMYARDKFTRETTEYLELVLTEATTTTLLPPFPSLSTTTSTTTPVIDVNN